MGKSEKLVMWPMFSFDLSSMKAFPLFSIFSFLFSCFCFFQEYSRMFLFFLQTCFAWVSFLKNCFETCSKCFPKKTRLVCSLLNTVKRFFFSPSIYFIIFLSLSRVAWLIYQVKFYKIQAVSDGSLPIKKGKILV